MRIARRLNRDSYVNQIFPPPLMKRDNFSRQFNFEIVKGLMLTQTEKKET